MWGFLLPWSGGLLLYWHPRFLNKDVKVVKISVSEKENKTHQKNLLFEASKNKQTKGQHLIWLLDVNQDGGTWELLLPLDLVFPSSFAFTLYLMRGRDFQFLWLQ